MTTDSEPLLKQDSRQGLQLRGVTFFWPGGEILGDLHITKNILGDDKLQPHPTFLMN